MVRAIKAEEDILLERGEEAYKVKIIHLNEQDTLVIEPWERVIGAQYVYGAILVSILTYRLTDEQR